MKKTLILLFASLMAGMGMQMGLELSGNSDKLGWWYTWYCGTAFGIVFFIVARLWKYWRHRKAIHSNEAMVSVDQRHAGMASGCHVVMRESARKIERKPQDLICAAKAVTIHPMMSAMMALSRY